MSTSDHLDEARHQRPVTGPATRTSTRNTGAEVADLLQPVAVGSAMLANRVAVAPMTNKQSAPDGTLSDAEIAWIAQRVEGGFGLVVTGAWAISPEGRTWHGQAGLYESHHEPALAKLGQRVAGLPARVVVQLIHAGSRSTAEITHEQGVPASDGPGYRAATDQDISRITSDYGAAAVRAENAGLHGVEIHAAHGFLPAQFLSDTQNRRADTWGGDLPARARFLRQVVRTIRGSVGTGFIVGVRLSPEDPRHGIHLHETAGVAAWLAQDGADYLHLSLADAAAMSPTHLDQHPVGAIRAAVPDLPLIAAGSVWTPEQALALVRHGADIVALGRAAILNPDWPRRVAQPEWTPTNPPLHPRQYADLGVTAPFLDYLQQQWPDLLTQTSPLT